jgi:phosphoglycolate phosphatase
MLIVFDLDGTLVDSVRDLAESVNDLLETRGASPLSTDEVGRMVGEGARQLVGRALSARRLDWALDEALKQFLQIYDRRLLEHTRPYPGIVDVLEDVHRRARLAVLTNKPARPTGRLLDALELRKYFADVLGGDEDGVPRKPDPTGLHLLMRRAGVANRATLLVGDSLADLETARNAGAAICLARYGFGFANLPADALRGNEYFVDAPSELTDVFQELQRHVGPG